MEWFLNCNVYNILPDCLLKMWIPGSIPNCSNLVYLVWNPETGILKTPQLLMQVYTW
jgi:hypothetical protein